MINEGKKKQGLKNVVWGWNLWVVQFYLVGSWSDGKYVKALTEEFNVIFALLNDDKATLHQNLM